MNERKTTIKCKIIQPAYIIRDEEHFKALVKREGFSQDSERYRMMLDLVTFNDYVESASTGQGGNVTAVIRDMKGFPVCLEIRNSGGTDYMSVDRVDLWEQWTAVPGGYGYYGDDPSAMCWEWEE